MDGKDGEVEVLSSPSLSSPFKFEFMWAQEEAFLAVEIYIVREGGLPAHISLWAAQGRSYLLCVCFLLLLLLPSLEFLCYEKGETMTHNLKKEEWAQKTEKGETGRLPFPPYRGRNFSSFLGCRAAAAAVCRSLASPLTQIINPHGGGGKGKGEKSGSAPSGTSRIRRTKGVETTLCLYALQENGEFLFLSTLAEKR